MTLASSGASRGLSAIDLLNLTKEDFVDAITEYHDETDIDKVIPKLLKSNNQFFLYFILNDKKIIKNFIHSYHQKQQRKF